MRTRHAATLALVLFAARPALADDSANIATARSLGIEGVLLADAGKCREAIDKLERAERLHHAPTTATRLGECEIEVGRLVAGSERLQRVVREPLPPNAHPAFVAAVTRARTTLERVLPRIPSVVVSVHAPAGVKYGIVIDGEAVPDAIVDTNRFIDPGTHEIVATAKGYVPARAKVTIAEGETKTVTLDLVPEPPSLRTEAAFAPPESGRSVVPALVAFGIGTAGVAVGIVGGLQVASTSSELEASCDANRVCPPERASDLESARTWATVSTVGFAAGAVGLVAGTIYLLAAPGGRTQGPRATPAVGLGTVGVSGAF